MVHCIKVPCWSGCLAAVVISSTWSIPLSQCGGQDGGCGVWEAAAAPHPPVSLLLLQLVMSLLTIIFIISFLLFSFISVLFFFSSFLHFSIISLLSLLFLITFFVVSFSLSLFLSLPMGLHRYHQLSLLFLKGWCWILRTRIHHNTALSFFYPFLHIYLPGHNMIEMLQYVINMYTVMFCSVSSQPPPSQPSSST